VAPYSFTREPKPATTKASRVTIESLNPDWVKALEAEWQAHLKSPDINHVVMLDSPQSVTRHAAHARAWGLSKPDGQKVEIRKLPRRDEDSENLLRLSMEKYDPNAPKKGRKPKSAEPTTSATPAKAS
jgi:hypothetical protein